MPKRLKHSIESLEFFAGVISAICTKLIHKFSVKSEKEYEL